MRRDLDALVVLDGLRKVLRIAPLPANGRHESKPLASAPSACIPSCQSAREFLTRPVPWSTPLLWVGVAGASPGRRTRTLVFGAQWCPENNFEMPPSKARRKMSPPSYPSGPGFIQ